MDDDPSARRSPEDGLAEEERRYHSIFASIREDIIVIDRDFRITDVYHEILVSSGLSREDVVGQRCFEVLHGNSSPCDQHEAQCTAREVFETGEPRHCMHVHHRSDGSPVHVDILMSPLRDRRENVTHVIAAIRDATDLIETQHALRLSEDRFRSVVDQAGDALFLHSPDGRILDVNRRACDSLGYTRKDLLSMTVAEIDVVSHEQLGPLWDTLERGRFATYEGRHRRRDGTVFPVEVRLSVSEIGDDRLLLALARDITERQRGVTRIERLRHLEEALLGLGTLQQRVKRITDGVVEILDADFARIWLVKPGDLCEAGCVHADVETGPHVCRQRDRCLHLVASSGRYTHVDGKVHRRVPFGCYKIGRVAAAEEPGFLTNDVVHDPGVHDHGWAEELGLVSFAGYRLLSTDGEPVGVLALFAKHEISSDEQAQLMTLAGVTTQVVMTASAEEKLREKAYIIDSASSAIATADNDGLLTYVNPAFLDAWGFDDVGEILGRPLPDFWMVEDRFDEILAALNNGGSWSGETRARRKDGTLFDAQVSAAMVRDWEGHPVGLMSTTTDISERKRAEEKVRSYRDWLDALVRAIPNPLFAKDREGRYNLVNPAWEVFQGVSAADVLGKTDQDSWSDADANSYHRMDLALMDAGGVQIYEHRLRNASGEFRDVIFQKTCFHGADGDVAGMVGTINDLTDLKRSERDRRELESRMQHAQKLESLGVLAGGIAHDFNNLLVAVLGHADLALSEMSAVASGRGCVEEVKKAAMRASELSNEMLAYSGKGRFVVKSLNLNAVVREMGQLMEAAISKMVALQFDLTENLPPVEVDVAQVRQVIMNLVTNASDAFGGKRGVVKVSTGSSDVSREYLANSFLDEELPRGRYVHLEVSDTGCGMDEETRAKLFDPFFTTKTTGRGLGLAAVLGIVRGHHGTIRVYSEPGKGSSIKVLLPAGLRPVEGLQAHPVSTGETWRGEGTVLVVDDEQSVRNIAKRMLEHCGFSVLTAEDGEVAVETFRAHADEIVAVFLDMTMPKMNGEEAFRELRRIRPDIKVVLASGYNQQDASSRFVGKGLAGFLRKPFELKTFVSTFREVMEGKG